MAEKILWLAKCKLNGMNQRVGMVYDDQTGQVLTVQAFGHGRGTLVTRAWLPGNVKFVDQRLAHKIDAPIINLRPTGIVFDDLSNPTLPRDVVVQVSWL